MALKGSKTHENLRNALPANHRQTAVIYTSPDVQISKDIRILVDYFVTLLRLKPDTLSGISIT
jgi:hypothetical protein